MLIASCDRRSPNSVSPSRNSAHENQERVRIGLRQLKPDWFLYSAEFDEENWKITPSDRIAKKLHRDKTSKLVWEEDYYYSGQKFVTEKGQDWELIAVHYDYNSGTLAIHYIGQDSAISEMLDKLDSTSAVNEKLLIADQILKKWAVQGRH